MVGSRQGHYGLVGERQRSIVYIWSRCGVEVFAEARYGLDLSSSPGMDSFPIKYMRRVSAKDAYLHFSRIAPVAYASHLATCILYQLAREVSFWPRGAPKAGNRSYRIMG